VVIGGSKVGAAIHQHLVAAFGRSKGSPIIVTGAGISMALAASPETAAGNVSGQRSMAYSWARLVSEGENYAREHRLLTDEDVAAALESASNEGRTTLADQLITRAALVKTQLGGSYATWLNETFGHLVANNPELVGAIKQLWKLGSVLATTNYDRMVDDELNFSPVILTKDLTEALTVLNGEQTRRVIHFHGVYSTPSSVILGRPDYDERGQDQRAQIVQRIAGLSRSFIFLGCGDGLNDPNFGGLLRWLKEFQSSPVMHFRLGTTREVAEWQPTDQVLDISYGTHHDELPSYLGRLADAITDSRAAQIRRKHPAPVTRAGVEDWCSLPHDRNVIQVALDSDGTRLATLESRAVNLWQLPWGGADPPEEPTWTHHVSPEAFSLAWSHDGETLATGAGWFLQVWDLKTGEIIWRESTPASHLSFSGRSRLFSAGRNDYEGVFSWNVRTGKPGKKVMDRESVAGDLTAIAGCSIERYLFATARQDGRIQLWSEYGRYGKAVELWRTSYNPGATNVAWCRNGSLLVTTGPGGPAHVYKAKKVTECPEAEFSQMLIEAFSRSMFERPADDYLMPKVAEISVSSDVVSVALSGDGSLLALGGSDGSLNVWRIEANARSAIPLFEALVPGQLASLSFSDDGSVLAGAHGNDVHLWRLSELSQDN
jgi:WD40 repeat protein